MAFMALFFWVFIPVILLALAMGMLQQALDWIRLNDGLIYWAAAGILVLNILIIFALARVRAGHKRAGTLSWAYIRQLKGFQRLERAVWKLTLYLWPVCAGFWALLCAAVLVIQPIRFIPEHFLQIPEAPDCFGQWEIVGHRGPASRTQEEIEPYIGVRIVYEEERFTANGQVYPLEYVKNYSITSTYQSRTVWEEERVLVPNTTVVRSFDSLGIEGRNVRRIWAQLQEKQDRIVLGELFYILDWDTILIYCDGVFFQAERVG